MALLPGYRYLGTHEKIPKRGALADDGGAGTRNVISSGRHFAPVANFYMVPVSKPRRTKSYTPPETSLQAYESQKDKAPADKRKILAYIMREDLPKGATCDEVEAALSLSHQTASARIRELFQEGSIRDSGLRRNTRTGRKATVWEAATA